MQARHVPTITARYWTAITLASVFGTNMGDFYAHESGLGLLGGLPILVALFGLVYLAERKDKLTHDAYYWVCIIIMRTGATNIADYMAGRRGLGIDRLVLSIGLGVAVAVFAYIASRRESDAPKSLPDTNPLYWVCMLTAGVFGTAFGDYFEHLIGQGVSAAMLTVVLALALIVYFKAGLKPIFGYWLTVSVCRTTDTAIGDWLAESKDLQIGLTVCTIASGLVLAAVLIAWRDRRPAELVPAE